MIIYVWNLPPTVSENLFREIFESFGQVSLAETDTDHGPLRRFAFVEMPDRAEARAAIRDLNRKALLGEKIIVYGSSEN